MAARVKTVCFQICTTIFVTEIQLLFFYQKSARKIIFKVSPCVIPQFSFNGNPEAKIALIYCRSFNL